MAISKTKKRRQVTLELELWQYLDEVVLFERSIYGGNYTVSKLISSLVSNDKKIKEALNVRERSR